MFTAGTLSDGQLATSIGALYTVPGATKAYVKALVLFNDNAAQQTIVLYIKRSGGTRRKWRRFVLEQNETANPIEEGGSITLSTGDAIEAITTTATAVDYTVTGVLET